MLITVPRSLMIYPPGYGGDANEQLTFGLDGPGLNGLRGLGQTPDTSGDTYDLESLSGASLVGPSDVSLASSLELNGSTTLPSVDSGATTLPGLTQSQIDNLLTPNAPTSTSTNSTTAQDIAALGPALAAASKAISVATGPYAIPNSNYIYNPATGQILLNGAAVGTYNPLTGSLSAYGASSVSSYLPLLLGVGAIVLLVSMMGNRK